MASQPGQPCAKEIEAALLTKVLKGKIHRAAVTETNLDYVGSITIDRDLCEQAGITEYEAVLVADLNNGTRHETYVIYGEPGSGVVCVNGAAARLVSRGDLLIILSFAYLTRDEMSGHQPHLVRVDAHNRPLE